MSRRIENLNKRFADIASILKYGVEVQLAEDPLGYRYSQAVRTVVRTAKDDDPEVWADVLGAAKSLRSKLLLHPEEDSRTIAEHVDALRVQITRIRPNLADSAMLDEALAAAVALRGQQSAVGELLWQAVEDFTAEDCLVVVGSRRAAEAISDWIAPLGARVLTPGDLRREPLSASIALIVGPPRFFHSSMVTSPMTSEVTFIVPNWFGDRSIPTTSLSEYAEKPILVTARETGPKRPAPLPARASEAEGAAEVQPDETELEPSALWKAPQDGERTPRPDEVRARKVLLSGGYSVWIDAGDRIRSLDPYQPAGENVVYLGVATFRDLSPEQLARTEIYLLLRSATKTQHSYLHERARASLGPTRTLVQETQQSWKSKLRGRIDSWGEQQVVRSLEDHGVQAAGEAVAWTSEEFTRPLRNDDFRLLLDWLDLATDGPEYRNATRLRSAFRSESHKVQTQIGRSVTGGDLAHLKQDGHRLLPAPEPGEPGLTAARVLAVSPHDEIKPRHEVRVLRADDAGRWLQ
ncbi:hypothetical protein [Paraoerskovia marina]|uniref:hypothetical protein n=1 Tax=Paraoerskovia marina TaxID=545619 RepID=UPI000492B2B6|nr:hypothetical protein [Paraoerskovia marina]